MDLPSIGIFDEQPSSGQDPEPEDVESAADPGAIRTVSVLKTMSTHRKMRMLSEAALSEALPWHLEEGCAYHVVSYGDVDALTFLRHIARGKRLDYAIIATWCMAQTDADEIASWVGRGIVGRVDFVVGEVFQSHSRYREIKKTLEATAAACGGRVLRCRTHMKVMVLYGAEYDACIESSANIDTNPRAEQTCITVDSGLCDFYKAWCDALPNFDRDPEGWTPWERA